MNTLEATVEELKSLPPAKLEVALNYIHGLTAASVRERRQALEKAFGSLTPAEAEEMERAIAANCEGIDASQW
ncbi:MAG: hypothetical protein H7A45_00325 [Verrucomicrobiales bacterium]|nr:hypothetical protein [Verrucomicrobiales bacterium]